MPDTPQQSDKSKYIRTYAKDVAALTGTQQKPRAPQPDIPPPTPPPAPTLPPLQMPEATEAVAQRYNTPLPPPLDQEREATIARLKKKMEESAQVAIETPPPPPAIVEAPPPPPPPRPSIDTDKPTPLHTYKTDFADRIDEKQASTFSVLAAEGDARKSVPVRKNNNRLMVIGAIALVLLGGAGIGGAAWYVMRSSVIPGGPLAAPSLVFADEQVRLTSSGPDLMSELAALANEPLPEGNVIVVYLSEATTTAKGAVVETPLSGGALIATMGLPAPDILLRNIAKESTVGVISAGETRPFFVLRVTSYERTFAGMLAWEISMARDLAVLYPAREAGSLAPIATTTALGTSTPQREPVRVNPTFEDAVVASHDVRTLRDSAGNTLILYGYADKQTLIIARDEAAYSALVSKLSANQ